MRLLLRSRIAKNSAAVSTAEAEIAAMEGEVEALLEREKVKGDERDECLLSASLASKVRCPV